MQSQIRQPVSDHGSAGFDQLRKLHGIARMEAPMRLSGLYQPRNPLFWMAMALNALSAMLAWIVQNRELQAWAALLLGGFALANVVVGSWLAWRLLRDAPTRPKSKD